MDELIEAYRYCADYNSYKGCAKCPINKNGMVCGTHEHAVKIAADAIERLQAQIPKWVSVKDRLPEGRDEWGQGVYVLATDGVVTTRAFYGYPGGHDEWFINAGEQWEATFDRAVTHWMPLPDAPEVEG